ncbi:uncharacterized protein LOC142226463 [Haematobia irritans]|uniref:uncharacterized protein LOC142226463 n=1 Tax=Haematobia irritans TaxID=7368 RepID=UPI003F50303B
MIRFQLLVFVAFSTLVTLASSQYSYEKPSRPISDGHTYEQAASGGHYFPALPTIKPLPAVPNLPPLPTGRPKVSVNQQTLYQTHPTLGGNTYTIPSGAGVGKIAQQYIPPSGAIYNTRPQSSPTPSFGISGSGGSYGSAQTTGSGDSGLLLGTFTPGHNNAPTTQPLRVPFGGTAVIHPLPVQHNPLDGRPLKQYAVIEIIDNDLKQNTEPFLQTPVRNDFRALFGATGTGASAPALSGVQIDSRANFNILEQQRLALSQGNDNQIALGSGGLGLVRLPDGKIHLGSGSLGYISNQMVRANANDARTRSELARADALHFGHGSLAQSTSSFSRY